MRNIISLILLFGLIPLASGAEELQLQDNVPQKYTVVSGDTLWGVSAKFLKDPWKWPQLWGMNRDQVKNPHWIYPGNVLVLDMTGGTPKLKVQGSDGATGAASEAGGATEERETIKLSPRIQTQDLGRSIPSIPRSAIEPFLSQSLIVDKNVLDNAPAIIGNADDRVILAAGNMAYVRGSGLEKNLSWRVFRLGKELINPENNEPLGYQAEYIGDAKVVALGNISKIQIVRSVKEVSIGDRLLPLAEKSLINYVPHAPEKDIKGRIIATSSGMNMIAKYSVVTLNLGSRDSLEVGHVLEVLGKGKTIDGVSLPDERSGLLFVIKTFDKASYAVVLQSERQLGVLDVVKTP